MRPNILWIMDDQHHAGCLGAAGHPVIKTPHLDALARQGVMFTRCYTAHAICRPSRAAFHTGLYPHTSGVFHNNQVIPDGLLSMAAHFRTHGYQTCVIGKSHLCYQWRTHGYQHQVLCDWGDAFDDAGRNDYYQYLIRHDMAHLYDLSGDFEHSGKLGAFSSAMPVEHSVERFTGNEAVRWLEDRDPGSPFFLWLSFQRPHGPYAPSAPYDRMYDPGRIPLPSSASDSFAGKPPEHAARKRLARPGVDFAHATEEDLRRAMAYYYGLISHIDEEIGKVLRRLQALRLADRTIVVFSSDHGDFAGEHGLMGKMLPTYDALYRIPMIVKAPCTQRRNFQEPGLVESLDLFPTLCDLAAVPAPEHLQGASWAPLLRGEHWHGKDAVFFEDVMYKTVRTERYKLTYYVRHPDDGELYDLHTDPDECRNLFHDADHQGTRRQLEGSILHWLAATSRPPDIRLYAPHAMTEDGARIWRGELKWPPPRRAVP